MIIAIDPGTVRSAFVQWDGEQIHRAEIMENENLLDMIRRIDPLPVLVVEQIRCYGMTMGADMIDTVFWSGRFCEAYQGGWVLVPRMQVKMHLCHTSRAKDSNIRQALVDRFGPVPTKKRPNPTYGGFKISKDLWQAWGLAVTCYDGWMGKTPGRAVCRTS